MRGYVARKGDRWYAVVYEDLDPVTGREKRSWHPAGSSREEAEQLATRLATAMNGRNDMVRALTFGGYLTGHWLPGKRITLAESTWDGYRRKIDRHISLRSAIFGYVVSAPTTWKRCTTDCSTPATTGVRWLRRRSWRCISSSAVHCRTPSSVAW